MLQTATWDFSCYDPYYFFDSIPSTAFLQAKWAPYCSLNQALKSSGLSMTPEPPTLKNLSPTPSIPFCNAAESSVGSRFFKGRSNVLILCAS